MNPTNTFWRRFHRLRQKHERKFGVAAVTSGHLSHQRSWQRLLVFLFFGLGLVCTRSGDTLGAQPDTASQTSALLSPVTMREDLDYTVRILRNVHPATLHGFSDEQQAVIDTAYRRIQESATVNAFYFIANTVICSLQDGHTHLGPKTEGQNRRIPIPLLWFRDGFFVAEDCAPLQAGDRIVGIGKQGIASLYEQMRALIPAENEHYRKWSMAGLIQREEFLDYLGCVKADTVEVEVERAGSQLALITSLTNSPPRRSRQPSRPWVGYQIDPEFSLGIFHLDSCTVNEQYTKALTAFFSKVGEKHVRNVAIDARRNGGGNSSVITEFFKHLKIDRYRSFGGEIRYSEEVAQKNGYSRTAGYVRGKPSWVRNDRVKDSKQLFDGRLFVLTSAQTFSSGNWFAVVVKDNNLGTVIGEPTGNAPSSYGDVPTFQMPNTKLAFTVSHKKWIRPNPKNDPEDALYPDIPVYTTIDEVIRGVDPQVEKLKAVVKEGSPGVRTEIGGKSS